MKMELSSIIRWSSVAGDTVLFRVLPEPGASLASKTEAPLWLSPGGQTWRLPCIKGKKTMKIRTLIAVTLGLGAFSALAQQAPGGPGGPGGPPRGHPPVPPIMAVLDTNKDGELDAAEIANASAALKTLDKNGDGKLTIDELMPPPPGGGTNQFRPAPPPGARPPVPPIMAALDANGDGELDADEIANASAALLKLDTNGDGKLSREELRPKWPGGPGGPGHPGHPDGSAGPDDPGMPNQPEDQ
jgi:hypothetical protein